MVLLATAAQAEDPAQFPDRRATPQDIQLLSTKYAGVRQELLRIGLRQETGKVCTTFVTADSVRPIETPLPLDGGTLTLPYASFLIWSANRPFADAVLYHVFATADKPYQQPQKLPGGTTNSNQAYEVRLAARQELPSAAAVVKSRDALSNPFTHLGMRAGTHALAVKPYLLPIQNDDPASVLPTKSESSLKVTCLSDPNRVTNCLCASTD